MLNLRPADPSRGFTLVELMVTIAILAVLMALGAPQFKAWLQNTQVRTATESIQNGLQLARAEAVRRNCNVEFVVNADTSWSVTAKPPSGDVPVQSRTANEGSSSSVTAALTGSTKATFDGLGRVVNAGPLTAVTVTSSVTSQSMTVEVGTGGQIRLCNPLVTDTTDPRKCKNTS
ncbi:MAG TPA: GspH/FimT family pseudopilin [Rhodocyclaceae bacterium]|nr:GspH/FimT family pseudopilin [Rhodocyclaceae bacterium]